ncbi:MAG TPA: Gfo/Idh/MocA family oxidoreductase [Planctomycetaceae bacterium]|nr:Gfo/Idh/MocA family oxidoreductase [Planctomycetaceae bacterium]
MSESSSSPREKLRLALVGCGRISHLHAERVSADNRAVIVALFDPDPSAAQSLRSGVAKSAIVCSSLETLLEAQFDAAVVASPTHLHFEQAKVLMARGIPVLCEKPLARSRQEILDLIELSRNSGMLLSVAYQRRMSAAYRTIRGLVRSGKYGPVRAVVSHNVENWQSTIRGTWRNDPHMNPGGFVGDAGSHKIDAVFYVTGLLPAAVFARTDCCGSRVEIVASVSALLTDGVPLTMDFVGHAQHFSELLSVHCAQADLVLRDGDIWRASGSHSERVALAEADSNPITAFLDSMLNGAENVAPAECALPVFDFTQALLESARLGSSVVIG